MTKKRVQELVNKSNKEVFYTNIPQYLIKTNFNRNDLHSVYILYKALHEITSQRYKRYSILINKNSLHTNFIDLIFYNIK